MERPQSVQNAPSLRRRKELLRRVLDVDVDEISRKVVMQHHFRTAVETASSVNVNSRIWRKYSQNKGGIILLLRGVRELGLGKSKEQKDV
jgi:hypothetical protein